MSLGHLDINKEVKKENQAVLDTKDNILISRAGQNLVINKQSVQDNNAAFNAINAEILANKGLTNKERDRIKAWSLKKQTFKSLAERNIADNDLAEEESYKYSDYYAEPGYFEKKTRRGAAEDSQENIKKINKVLKKENNLDNRLEVIRLYGHAECENLRAQGYSETSAAYLEARNRLLSRRIRAIEKQEGALNNSKYKKLYNNAVKELKKNISKLKPETDIKKDKLTKKLHADEVKKSARSYMDDLTGEDRALAERLINNIDHKSFDLHVEAENIITRNKADFIELCSWDEEYTKALEKDKQFKPGQERHKLFSTISPFLSIAKTGEDGLYDRENAEKADSNTRLLKAYAYEQEDVFNTEIEKNFNNILNFNLPFKVEELKGKEDQLISYMPEMDKLIHTFYIFFADSTVNDTMFTKFYRSLGIESKEDRKMFSAYLKEYFSPVCRFVNAFTLLAQAKYGINLNNIMEGSECGKCTGGPGTLTAKTLVESYKNDEINEDRMIYDQTIDGFNEINDDKTAEEMEIKYKEAYNLGIAMMHKTAGNITIRDLAARFKAL